MVTIVISVTNLFIVIKVRFLKVWMVVGVGSVIMTMTLKSFVVGCVSPAILDLGVSEIPLNL